MENINHDVIIGVIVGFVLGLLVAWVISLTRGGKNSKEYGNLEKEYNDYRKQVNQHFSGTADAIDQLTKSYEQVFTHLSAGAQSLMDEDELKAQIAKRKDKTITLSYLSDEQAKPQTIAEKTKELIEETKQATEEAKDAAVEKTEKVVEKSKATVAENTEDAVEKSKEAVSEAAEAVTEKAKAAVEKGKESVEQAKAAVSSEKAADKDAISLGKAENETAIDNVKKHIHDESAKKVDKS